MDARKILVKRLAVSLVVGLFLAICLCAALDKGESISIVARPAQAAGDLPITVPIIWNVQVVPIQDVNLGFHVTWEADILPGDNDFDGKVSIADITPLAMHFGEEVGDDWYLTKLDGNRNGMIDAGDVDRVELFYSFWVPWFRLELWNYETGIWRLARVTNWSSHLVPVTERCAFEADVQAMPGEWTLRIQPQPVYTPLSPGFEGASISLLPYLHQ